MATTHPPWWTGALRHWKFAGWSHDEQQLCVHFCVAPKLQGFSEDDPQICNFLCGAISWYIMAYHGISHLFRPLDYNLKFCWAHGRFPEFHRVPMRERLGSRKGHHQIWEGPIAIHGLPPVCRFFWNPVSVPGMFPVARVFAVARME